MFEQFSGDAASYLLCKVMDRENGARYLKQRYAKKDWAFLEELFRDHSGEKSKAAVGTFEFASENKKNSNIF